MSKLLLIHSSPSNAQLFAPEKDANKAQAAAKSTLIGLVYLFAYSKRYFGAGNKARVMVDKKLEI